MGGKPCFPGTRVPVQMLFDWLAGGRTVDYFVDQLRSVRPEQVRAALMWAASAIRSEVLPSPLPDGAVRTTRLC